MRFRIHGTVPVGLALLAVLAFAACTGGAEDGSTAPAAVSEAEASRALQLFQEEGCNGCHGDLAEGIEGSGPALRDLAPYWDVERLKAYLFDPEGFREANPDFEDRRSEEYPLEMPPFDHLDEQQRELLARWLMSR